MPYYDYECKDCGHTFETFQSMSDALLEDCPSCNRKGLRRLIGGGAGIIFKGSGFYVNDSRRSSEASSASSAEKKSPDSKKPSAGSTSSDGKKTVAAN